VCKVYHNKQEGSPWGLAAGLQALSLCDKALDPYQKVSKHLFNDKEPRKS
jgi:hypothetical protein